MNISKVIKCGRYEYYRLHLNIINQILPIKLTDNEILMLSEFMSLEGDIREDMFGVSGRKIVRDRMKISFASMSIYLRKLQDKGFIVNKDGRLEINKNLLLDNNEQVYIFKLVKDVSRK